jgi:plasmid stability protein
MPTLYVRDIPEEVLQRVKKLASQEKRSLSAEVAILLDRALQEDTLRSRRAEALDRIERRRKSFKLPPGTPDTLALLREDRAR